MSKGNPLTAMLKGLVTSYIITVVVFVVFAILITYTNTSENHVGTITRLTTAIVCVISGFITARSANNKGLVWGIASGVGYIVVMTIAAFAMVPDYKLGLSLCISLLLAATGGGLGGVVGINVKH